jgi:hypothetical protein
MIFQVENVTSSGRKPRLTEKFHKLTKEKKITIVLATREFSILLPNNVYYKI